jgi:YfiH family protein
VDGHATAVPRLLLGVTVADCVPVYLADPVRRLIALLHAGWRGTAAGILDHGVALLVSHGARVDDLVMHAGVGICGACYEVGPEVLAAFGFASAGARGHLDLRLELARRARAAGVRTVTVSPWCAAHDRHLFFSHRASGGDRGRMVAYLGLLS